MRLNTVFDMSYNKFVAFHFVLGRDTYIPPTSRIEAGEWESSTKTKP